MLKGIQSERGVFRRLEFRKLNQIAKKKARKEGKDRCLRKKRRHHGKKRRAKGASRTAQRLGLGALIAVGPGSSSGQGIQIQQAVWHSRKKS